eukprot:404700-Pleurochrysis_carterae.AAC.2
MHPFDRALSPPQFAFLFPNISARSSAICSACAPSLTPPSAAPALSVPCNPKYLVSLMETSVPCNRSTSYR